MISVDAKACSKDGACIRACPVSILRLRELPEMTPGRERACLRCGHCVAVCPRGALTHKDVPLESCPPVDAGLALDEARVVQFLRSRRSMRLYQDRVVEKERLEALILIARYAPTASNRQSVRWLVVRGKARLRELSGMAVDWMRAQVAKGPAEEVPAYMRRLISAWDEGRDVITRGAPALVVAHDSADNGDGLVDLSIALSYLELAAPALGLSACWGGLLQKALLDSPALKEALGLPAGRPHHYPMMVGYPGLKYHRLPERHPPGIEWR